MPVQWPRRSASVAGGRCLRGDAAVSLRGGAGGAMRVVAQRCRARVGYLYVNRGFSASVLAMALVSSAQSRGVSMAHRVSSPPYSAVDSKQ
eukprot:7530539-Pyramimonas_sp.AAC.1